MAARKGFGGLVDQSLMSGTNFLTGLVLARYCEPAEYGGYALAWSVLLALNALQNTLITGPMMVLGPPREEGSFRRYIGSLVLPQILGSALLVVGTLLAVMLVPWRWSKPSLEGTFTAMALALFFVQAQEFCRRILFAKLRIRLLLRNDIVYCGFQLAGLVSLWCLNRQGWNSPPETWLTARNVFLSMALAGLAASAMGFWQVRSYLSRQGSRACEPLRENWNFARWGLGALAGDVLHIQGSLALVAIFAGTAGSAIMEAPRLILSPLNILQFTGVNILTPLASKALGRQGKPGLRLLVRRLAPLWALPFVVYPLVVGAAPQFWLSLFYGEKYRQAESVLLLWAAVHSIVGLRTLAGVLVLVMRRPDISMYAAVGSGVLSLMLSAALIPAFGPAGAVTARLLADLAHLAASVLVAWRLLAARKGAVE